MADSTIVFAVLGVVVVLFVADVLPVEVVAVGSALVLWATDVLGLDEALAGFGDPTVVYIAALFVVSEALDAAGITTWAGRHLAPRAGESGSRLLLLLMLLAALLTAVISVNGAVAALLPVVVVLAVSCTARRRTAHAHGVRRPRRLDAGAHRDAGERHRVRGRRRRRRRLLRVLRVRPGRRARCSSGRSASSLLFGRRLLPDRTTRQIPKDFSDHARTLVSHYEVDDGDSPLYDRRGAWPRS